MDSYVDSYEGRDTAVPPRDSVQLILYGLSVKWSPGRVDVLLGRPRPAVGVLNHCPDQTTKLGCCMLCVL
jgi:hypothetical protein